MAVEPSLSPAVNRLKSSSLKLVTTRKTTGILAKLRDLTYLSPEGFPPECSYGTQLVWYGIFPEYKQPLTSSVLPS